MTACPMKAALRDQPAGGVRNLFIYFYDAYDIMSHHEMVND